MKHFLKLVLAVVVGLGVSAFLFVVFIAIVAGASGSSTSPVEDNSVLKLNFNYTINDRTKMEDIDLMSGQFSIGEVLGLEEIIKTIEAAKTDSKIKGIYIEMSTMPNSFATIDALRRALIDFKTSGKFVMAYGEYVAQKSYYLASVADNIYINPEGLVEMRGIGTQLTFFKKFLDNLEAKVEVFKVGTFKSAIEPFILEEASDANRLQLEYLLGGVKEDFINNISKDRKMDKAKLEQYINELAFSSADTSAQLGLIDAAKYYDEVLSEMMTKMGLAKTEDIKFVTLSKYNASLVLDKKTADKKIAVVYAEGDIVSGKAKDALSSEEYAEIISKLRQDDEVKAIVLRINSPGGSALASEVIWREIEKAKETKKVVVSMGSVAASGGYYIACNADRIFAEENTITGSIGVFGLVPNIEKFLENKVGVTFDEVNLNTHASMNGVTNELDDYEKSVIQKGVDKVYDTFTKRVAAGRGMHQDSVKVYAEGRVWTGEQAKKIGLVDEIGDLRSAIKYAAKLIETEDYEIQEFPRKKEQIEEILEQFGMETVKENMLKKELGAMYPYYKETKKLEAGFNIVQAKMPFVLDVK